MQPGACLASGTPTAYPFRIWPRWHRGVPQQHSEGLECPRDREKVRGHSAVQRAVQKLPPPDGGSGEPQGSIQHEPALSSWFCVSQFDVAQYAYTELICLQHLPPSQVWNVFVACLND